MKHIATAFAVLLTSFALVSCGGKKDGGSEAEIKSHSEIADGVVEQMTTMMQEMSKIKDVASAEAFAEKMPEIKEKMKDYLKAAKKLDEPTTEEKLAFKTKMEEAQEKAGPAMMAMMMGMAQNPDADAIGKVLEEVMDDEEMDKAMEELENIYEIEEEDAVSVEPAGPAGEPAPAE